ncbi:hypothetical protein B0T25DRAFT_538678 [Lasiosphaeria hispida]|uniref:Uncharacterized protein n=1 Tax=Lasiosphaeria hispida TaxID=260671 RepID=A0AAJ0HLU4_9PEZI|nr:hypothetical protein B0T25DRAFT_538678 [Lasiosphaeria hispida]
MRVRPTSAEGEETQIVVTEDESEQRELLVITGQARAPCPPWPKVPQAPRPPHPPAYSSEPPDSGPEPSESGFETLGSGTDTESSASAPQAAARHALSFPRPPPYCRIPDVKDIRLIWEQKNSGLNYSNLLQRMASDLAPPFVLEARRGFSDIKFHFDIGRKSLLMKQENIWIPSVNPESAGTVSLRTRNEIGHITTHAESICKHCRWDQEYSFLVPQMADLAGTEPLPDAPSKLPERMRCALFHEVGCQCWDSAFSGAVKSCPRCHTDYAFTVAEAPGVPGGRCFVFTSWKNMGNGAKGDRYWESHASGKNLALRVDRPGQVYDDYEGSRAMGPHLSNYTPVVPSGYIAALAALGKQEVLAI